MNPLCFNVKFLSCSNIKLRFRYYVYEYVKRYASHTVLVCHVVHFVVFEIVTCCLSKCIRISVFLFEVIFLITLRIFYFSTSFSSQAHISMLVVWNGCGIVAYRQRCLKRNCRRLSGLVFCIHCLWYMLIKSYIIASCGVVRVACLFPCLYETPPLSIIIVTNLFTMALSSISTRVVVI